MAVQIRGSQIQATSITADRLVTGFGLLTSQLADGASFLKRDGSVVMTASLNLGSQKIVSLLDPTAAQDAATKNYTDTQDAALSGAMFKKDGSVVATGSFNLGNFRITNVADPINPQDLATKNYVDLAIQGLAPKGSTRAATTGNITLSGTQTIDGIALSAGDRVLVKNQTNVYENGIYVASASAWARSDDTNTGAELKGAFTFVQEGSTWADTGWVVTTDGTITLGTTNITWVQFSSAGVIQAGNGLTKSGSTLSVLTPAGSGIVVDATGVQVALDGSTLAKTSTGLKLADPGAAKLYLGNASGAAVAVTLSGDATVSNTGVVTITGAVKNSNMIFNETPSGAMNGSNTAFTLANTPVSGSESVFFNGQRLIPGSSEDYTMSGATITFVSYVPVSTDKIRVDYMK